MARCEYGHPYDKSAGGCDTCDEYREAQDDEQDEETTDLVSEMVESSHERWLEERRQSIGSSDSPGILGESPWASPVSVWADKTGSPVALPPETEERLRWGKLLEPVILAEYARRREIMVWHHDQNEVIRHEDFQNVPMHATPDGLDETNRVLEVKNWSSFATSSKQLRINGPPLLTQIQNQHQMACLGAEYGTIVILIGGNELWWQDTYRNDRFIQLLERTVCEFWEQFVEQGQMPPADGHSATVRTLERLHPEDSGRTIQLPENAVLWDQRLAKVKSEIRELESEKKELENQIKSCIGDATFGELPGVEGRYKWGNQERRAHMVGASKFRQLRRLKR
jgi:putative phage-type endonuclease